MIKNLFFMLTIGALALTGLPAIAKDAKSESLILIQNVKIFDGASDKLSNTTSILIKDNKIASISPDAKAGKDATVIDGGGRVLMPGLIDSHVHLTMSGVTFPEVLTQRTSYQTIQSVIIARDTLMNGVTTVRDMAGDTFGLKRAIDEDLSPGPRIYPAGWRRWATPFT